MPPPDLSAAEALQEQFLELLGALQRPPPALLPPPVLSVHGSHLGGAEQAANPGCPGASGTAALAHRAKREDALYSLKSRLLPGLVALLQSAGHQAAPMPEQLLAEDPRLAQLAVMRLICEHVTLDSPMEELAVYSALVEVAPFSRP
jgi:hypothetical protein